MRGQANKGVVLFFPKSITQCIVGFRAFSGPKYVGSVSSVLLAPTLTIPPKPPKRLELLCLVKLLVTLKVECKLVSLLSNHFNLQLLKHQLLELIT